MTKDGIAEKVRSDLRRYFAKLTEQEVNRGVLPHEQELLNRLR